MKEVKRCSSLDDEEEEDEESSLTINLSRATFPSEDTNEDRKIHKGANLRLLLDSRLCQCSIRYRKFEPKCTNFAFYLMLATLKCLNLDVITRFIFEYSFYPNVEEWMND